MDSRFVFKFNNLCGTDLCTKMATPPLGWATPGLILCLKYIIKSLNKSFEI